MSRFDSTSEGLKTLLDAIDPHSSVAPIRDLITDAWPHRVKDVPRFAEVICGYIDRYERKPAIRDDDPYLAGVGLAERIAHRNPHRDFSRGLYDGARGASIAESFRQYTKGYAVGATVRDEIERQRQGVTADE